MSYHQKKEAVTTVNPIFNNIFNYTRLFDSADKKNLGLKLLYTLHSLHFQHTLFLNPECLQLTHINSSDAERRKQDLIDATLSTRAAVKVEALLLQETSRKGESETICEESSNGRILSSFNLGFLVLDRQVELKLCRKLVLRI